MIPLDSIKFRESKLTKMVNWGGGFRSNPNETEFVVLCDYVPLATMQSIIAELSNL